MSKKKKLREEHERDLLVPDCEYAIECENLVKIYKTDQIEVVALQGLDLQIKKGELVAIVGSSGSGKSTLLNMLGGLDKPSAGALTVGGRNLLKFTEEDYMKYKRNIVGFVWQNNARNLVPYLTAVQNVELIYGFPGAERLQHRVSSLYGLFFISHVSSSRPRRTRVSSRSVCPVR